MSSAPHNAIQTWTDSEPIECVSVVPEAPNTAAFSFRSPSGAWFSFAPGQFITLELPTPGGPVYNTYTISSPPSRPVTITLTVKAQPDSIGTRWMLENLKPGMFVKAIGPAGAFTLSENPAGKFLFISAGSGVTPSLSMATFLYDRGGQPDICFISCARRPSELIAKAQLEGLAVRVPSIKLHFIVEDDDPFTVWTGYRGQLNQVMLGLIAHDYLEREVYCCGPEPFMDAVREMLISLGYDMSRYNQESFLAPTSEPITNEQPHDVMLDEDGRAQIIFAKSGKTVPCGETETILAVAKSNGHNIPSGCTFGVCGTCKVRKISGEVHMVHSGGISDKDVDDGYILACCSHPIGNVEIDV